MAYYNNPNGLQSMPRAFRPPEAPKQGLSLPGGPGAPRPPMSTGIPRPGTAVQPYQGAGTAVVPFQGAMANASAGAAPGAGSYGPGASLPARAWQRFAARDIGTRANQRGERADRLQGQADASLADPMGSARLFQSLFADQAKGITDPAMRDFQSTIRGQAANTASRFGGNASTEEQRVVTRTGDDFSRNLTEALARLAPQAGQMGLNYIGQQQAAGNDARGQEDQMRGDLISLINAMGGTDSVKKKGLLGTLAGTALGVGTKLATGGIG